MNKKEWERIKEMSFDNDLITDRLIAQALLDLHERLTRIEVEIKAVVHADNYAKDLIKIAERLERLEEQQEELLALILKNANMPAERRNAHRNENHTWQVSVKRSSLQRHKKKEGR